MDEKFNQIKKFLNDNHFHNRTEEGQHFLFHRETLHKIAEAAELTKEDRVLEIGSGPAPLTLYLASLAGFVIGIEKDERFRPLHEMLFKDMPNVKIIYMNALRLKPADFNEFTEQYIDPVLKNTDYKNRKWKITGNIPYGITSPLITSFVTDFDFSTLTFLIQKEVAERICSAPGSKQYGILSVRSQYFCGAQMKFNVKPTLFSPPPQVFSSVIHLTRKAAFAHQEQKDRVKFFRMIEQLFQQRRKNIVNTLNSVSIFNKTKEEIAKTLESLSIPINHRPENISIEDFVRIYDTLIKTDKG